MVDRPGQHGLKALAATAVKDDLMPEDKDFWSKLPESRENVPDGPDGADGATWQLTEERRDLLLKLRNKGDEWTDGDVEMAAPWTFVCCYRAGWVERQRLGGRTQYRISDDGLAALEDWRSH